jgi:hypothetical protein
VDRETQRRIGLDRTGERNGKELNIVNFQKMPFLKWNSDV